MTNAIRTIVSRLSETAVNIRERQADKARTRYQKELNINHWPALWSEVLKANKGKSPDEITKLKEKYNEFKHAWSMY